MLKKKVATTLTPVIRVCPKCGARCILSPVAVTECYKCGAIVNKGDDRGENIK